ncbi:unnamed protein product [Cochlearia groenlandica]
MSRRDNIARWVMKNHMKLVESAESSEESLFSLILPYCYQIPKVVELLNNGDVETISNNRVWAIDSAREKLQEMKRVSFDGLVLYTGIIGKGEERFTRTFKTFTPIKRRTYLYKFDKTFCTQPLHDLFNNDEKYGFIVMDHKGITVASLLYTHIELLAYYNFEHYLPFSGSLPTNLRLQYFRRYYEGAAQLDARCFVYSSNEKKIKGLILAGEEIFMAQVRQSLHPDLVRRYMTTVKVHCGGRFSIDDVVEVAADRLIGLRFLAEKELIKRFFNEIGSDLEVKVRVMKCNRRTKTEEMKSEEVKVEDNKEINEEWIVFEENVLLVEWLAINYTTYGFRLEIVTNETSESSMFCRGIEGIGGILLNIP